jgi:hypothetical protein
MRSVYNYQKFDELIRSVPRKKRYPRPKQEEGKLDVWFGKIDGEGPDLCVQSGDNGGGGATRGFVISFFSDGHQHSGLPGFKDGFLEEMDARGFDISTIKFSIRKKAACDISSPATSTTDTKTS